MKIVFLSRHDAGPSQMAYAFALREVQKRDLGLEVEVVTGGTEPAGQVQQQVVEAMQEEGLDLMGRYPSEIREDDIADADLLVGVGVKPGAVNVEGFDGETLAWDVQDTEGASSRSVKKARDRLEEKVRKLFDEYAP